MKKRELQKKKSGRAKTQLYGFENSPSLIINSPVRRWGEGTRERRAGGALWREGGFHRRGCWEKAAVHVKGSLEPEDEDEEDLERIRSQPLKDLNALEEGRGDRITPGFTWAPSVHETPGGGSWEGTWINHGVHDLTKQEHTDLSEKIKNKFWKSKSSI